MATWWNDLIKLWELPNVLPASKPNTPGIYYAVKQTFDRDRLLEDIGFVLERGLLENRAPAGLIVGGLRPGSVDVSYNRQEREVLHENGINPIVMKHGMPFVWGQRFYNATGEIHSISDNYGANPGLTAAFRAWIGEPMLKACFQPEPVFGHIGKRQSGDRVLRERFKLRRYLEMSESEVAENERLWTKEHPTKVIDPAFVAAVMKQPKSTPTYVPNNTAVEPPTVTGERVHALHRAIGARPQQIGLVDLDKR